MELIEKNDTKGFDQYIQKTENTICGEFPIRILMHTINNSKNYQNITTKFVRYDQSDKVKSFNGSSVSYAAGVTYLKWSLNSSFDFKNVQYNKADKYH